MQAIVERCCGLDVHVASIVACLLVGGSHEKPKKDIRRFGTTTSELERLRDWLREAGCTHVGMESTGIYWQPVYAILEGQFELIVGNAQHMKNVPGRKTDVKDAQWIAELVRHGLIKKSFVPPKDIRELRDLVRYRTKLVQGRTAERNRLQRLLETANIKLACVASDVFGMSGMAMLRALVQGESTPEQMAQLAKGRMRNKVGALEEALRGRVEEHHRFMLAMQLRRLEQIDADVALIDQRIKTRLEPYRDVQNLLMQIPGVDSVVAAVLIAELGIDMSVFPSAKHVSSWAGVCPGNNESAGKHKSGRTNKGNAHLRTILVQAAVGASRTKGTYFKDKFYRIRARSGPKRAAMTVAHKILVSAYRLMTTGEMFKELGDAYLDQQAAKRITKHLVRRLERLGFAVQLERQPNADEPTPDQALGTTDTAG